MLTGKTACVLFACNLFSMEQSCFMKVGRRLPVQESLRLSFLRHKANEEYKKIQLAEEVKRLQKLRALEGERRRERAAARRQQNEEDGDLWKELSEWC